MKVLHIVSGSLSGGAARGAYWLHLGLLDRGIESSLLCNDPKPPESPSVTSVAAAPLGKASNFLRRNADRLPLQLYPNRSGQIFSCGLVGYDFRKAAAYAEADILHLHWVNAGFLNMRHLAGVEKPVVWTLRDMWPMTGGCHYAMDCDGYRSACGRCPQLGSTRDDDLSRHLANRKQRLLPKHLACVGISSWLTEQAMASTVLAGSRFRTISNGVMTSDFYAGDKAAARLALGLPAHKKIIAAGAQNLSDFYKGGQLLLAGLALLDPDEYHLLLFGNGGEALASTAALDCTCTGFIRNASELRQVYSAADVFVAPSTMEAFGKTLVEAMACETPVVCFDATGPRDIVDHGVNGFKAPPFAPQGLADGIEWVVHDNVDGVTGRAARQKALSAFDVGVIAGRYVDLYNELLGAH